MPVTRISAEVAWSAKDGASRWMLAVWVVDRAGFVDRLADHVHDAAERGRADRHGDRAPVSITGWPRTRPSVVSMAMVRTVFSPRCWATSKHQAEGLAGLLVGVGGFQRVQDRRQVAVELDVDDGADDLERCGRWATAAGALWRGMGWRTCLCGDGVRGLRRRR
jgi:hypothetical protein